MEQGRYVPTHGDMMVDGSFEKTKASSEETVSIGYINPLNPSEARNVMMENEINQCENKPPRNDGAKIQAHPTLCRPIARFSAFNVYNPQGRSTTESCSKRVPRQGPLMPPPKPQEGAFKLVDGYECEPTIPLQCGHGCCAAELKGSHTHGHGSLLGPEFVDYLESPSFSELISIATDINNMAWIKSGLENYGAGVTENTGNMTASQGTANAPQAGFLGQGLKNGYKQFDEGPGKYNMGTVQEVLSTKIPRQPFAMPAKV